MASRRRNLGTLKKTKGHIYIDGKEGVKHMGYNGGADIKGNIDEIRIYDEALTVARVLQAMEEGQSVDLADKLTLSSGKIKTQ